MVNQRRADREKYVAEAGEMLERELEKVGIPAEIAGAREALLLHLREDGQARARSSTRSTT